MPQQTIIQSSFAAGMLSRRLRGRVDLAQYPAGAEDLTNLLVQTQGGATKRPGSYFMAAPHTNARVRLIPFLVSSDVVYVLEIGAGTMRFFRNRALLTDSTIPLTIATPWTLAELRSLKYAQSADVMYLFHPSHQPRKLSRTGAAAFQLALAVFENGPYDDENTGDVGASLPSPTSSSAAAGTTGGSASGSGTGDGPPPGSGNAGEGGSNSGLGGEGNAGEGAGGESGGASDAQAEATGAATEGLF